MTNSTAPDADEIHLRGVLHQRFGGPDAARQVAPTPAADQPGPEPAADKETEPVPPKGSRRLPDWWRKKPAELSTDRPDDETEDEPDEDEDDAGTSADPDPEDADADPEPESASARSPRRARRRRSTGNRPAYREDQPHTPRQSLLDAYASVPPRVRWLVYHGSAAALGYRIGWVHFSTDTAAWIAQHGLTDRQSLFWYAVDIGAVLLYRKFSPALLLVGWAATVPIASIVTGTLLYGTGYWT